MLLHFVLISVSTFVVLIQMSLILVLTSYLVTLLNALTSVRTFYVDSLGFSI